MNEQTWSAGVKTRTVDGALVMYPVVVSIEGKETELSLADAKRLLAGLATAVEVASAAEAFARSREHVLMYGPTRTGMSFVGNQSKLPLGPDEKPGAFTELIAAQ